MLARLRGATVKLGRRRASDGEEAARHMDGVPINMWWLRYLFDIILLVMWVVEANRPCQDGFPSLPAFGNGRGGVRRGSFCWLFWALLFSAQNYGMPARRTGQTSALTAIIRGAMFVDGGVTSCCGGRDGA